MRNTLGNPPLPVPSGCRSYNVRHGASGLSAHQKRTAEKVKEDSLLRDVGVSDAVCAHADRWVWQECAVVEAVCALLGRQVYLLYHLWTNRDRLKLAHSCVMIL